MAVDLTSGDNVSDDKFSSAMGSPFRKLNWRGRSWKRGLFMLLLALAFGIAQFVLSLLAVAQFLWLLFANEPNQPLLRFGRSLATWFADTARFLACVSDEKPFPWRDWPDAG
jgi:hypothetical protein